MLPHVFVSYAHADEDFVTRLLADLEQFGVPVWIDRKSLSTQDPTWDEGIRRALDGACALLLIATPASRQSPVVQGEVSLARARNRRVICVWANGDRWEDAAHVSLVHAQYVDCREERYALAIPRIVREIMLAQAEERTAPTEHVDADAHLSYGASGASHHVERAAGVTDDGMRSTTTPLAVLMLYDAGSTAGRDADEMDTIVECKRRLQGGALAAKLSLTVVPAVTSPEIVGAARTGEYDVIVLVGHYVCTREQEAAYQTINRSLLKSWQFSSILKAAMPLSVRALVLASSCCLLAMDDMAPCAPYVIAVETVADALAIPVFLEGFFAAYGETHSVEQGFRAAQLQLEIAEVREGVMCEWLSREQQLAHAGDELTVRLAGLPDPVVLNLGEVLPSLDALGVSLDSVIDLLSRKVKAHAALFRTPRENALLPIDGLLHGQFSWNASAGYIRCTRLIRFASVMNPIQWREWCRLLLTYNDLCGSEYRSIPEPGIPTARTSVAQGLHRFQRGFGDLKGSVNALTSIGITNAQYAYEMGATYLELAEAQYAEEDLPRTVASLEGALTCLHSIVESTMPPIGATSDARN